MDKEAPDQTIRRLSRGIRSILNYLQEEPPRIGDALFDCEALLVGSEFEPSENTVRRMRSEDWR